MEKEQVVEAKHATEAAHVAAEKPEKQILQCEVAKHKQMTAARKKVGMIMEVLASGSLICARCSLKGPSSLFFYLQLANDSSPGITCIKKGVGHWSTCKACHIDKAKCKWIAGSHADPKEGGSISRAVASSF